MKVTPSSIECSGILGESKEFRNSVGFTEMLKELPREFGAHGDSWCHFLGQYLICPRRLLEHVLKARRYFDGSSNEAGDLRVDRVPRIPISSGEEIKRVRPRHPYTINGNTYKCVVSSRRISSFGDLATGAISIMASSPDSSFLGAGFSSGTRFVFECSR